MGRFEFRRSQGVVPYGVGAIVDFPEASLMAAGLDMWVVESSVDEEHRSAVRKATQIVDGRLQDRLSRGRRRVRCFYSPVEAPDRGSYSDAHGEAKPRGFMPFVRFPRWHFCPRCRLLWEVPPVATTENSERLLRCHGRIRRSKTSAELCAERKTKERLQPVRFAVACRSGHIMDFPWREWVHRDACAQECRGGSGHLFIVATGAAGLQGVRVECGLCRSSRTLAGAFGSGAFRQIWDGCPGEEPWLGDSERVACNEPHVQAIQRGASNAYFPTVVTSILIPPYSSRVRRIVEDPRVWEVMQDQPLVDGRTKKGAYLRQLAEEHGVALEDLADAVDERRAGLQEKQEDQEVDETSYRHVEYQAFVGPRPPVSERRDFDIREIPFDQYDDDVRTYFERIVLLPRLRETRVLVGFSRVVPRHDPGELARLSRRELDWLPGYEVRGEGIFLALREARLREWEDGNTAIEDHLTNLRVRYDQNGGARSQTGPMNHRFVLVHTLAHLLIRQLSFDCGYDSSSLAERLYVWSDPNHIMCGLLIYTASGDAEGTLGGLVRQGEPGRLEPTLRAAIANARTCSSDPLCGDSTGQGLNGLNLAACHACALLPETACEEGNKFLDRNLVVGSFGQPELGYLAGFGTVVDRK